MLASRWHCPDCLRIKPERPLVDEVRGNLLQSEESRKREWCDQKGDTKTETTNVRVYVVML